MKAIVCTKYGSPEVLELRDIDKPVPKNNEVLIKIYATSVTAGDVVDRSCKVAASSWLPWRIFMGLTKPRRKIPGADLAGEIEAVGKDVTLFKAGDQVYGSAGWGSGAYAEYKCLGQDARLAPKPANMSYEEAAAIPFGGGTALHFLRKTNIQPGQKVLIYGASGSVGTYAVQIAKYYGAEVTGVCSSSNLEWVQSLGVDNVIDYTAEDFTLNGVTYDVIFDAVYKTSFSACKNSLAQRGVYATVGMGPILMIQMLWTKMMSSKRVISGIASIKVEDLVFLQELVEAGHLKSVIDRNYSFEQMAEAHAYVEAGHKKGNVAITIGHDNKI